MTDDMHTCSYHCDRPECIRRQRDELARENATLRESALGGYEDSWHALLNERDALRAELAKQRDGTVLLAQAYAEAEAELTKLRARIEAAPLWYEHPDWVGVGPAGVLTGLEGKRVRLLVEDGE